MATGTAFSVIQGTPANRLRRLATYASAHGISLWEALDHPEEAGVATAPMRGVQQLRTTIQSLQSGALELRVDELVQRVLDQTGYLATLEAERFGIHPQGQPVDDASLVVPANSVIEVRLPAALFRDREFVVEGKLDSTGPDRVAQFQVLTNINV